ncbi:transcriptional regulator, AraC family [Shewanella psychrophila]|uniref:Transcriptional regulator, AraC family n=1 Tax=Shewanella psychrophila TaxID=225848 RepID=A0A1S6HYN8_9GAMM|nr:AraC family transcriptional regulator [Shewanella psychrophila]AQS40653.1 transcriptional regulator, AraC family [Shewanella psychrophila]
MSIFNDLLSRFHLNATIFHRSLVCNPWSTDTSGSGLASFHLISSGEAFLHCEQYQSESLSTGDLVIFPHDGSHIIDSCEQSNAEHHDTSFVSYPIDSKHVDGTGLICGYFDFCEDKQHPLITQLPQCILLKKQDQHGTLISILDSLIKEANLGTQASDVILSRLSELFFLTLLRSLSLDTQTDLGLFRALQDPKMARVLQAIFGQLASPWDLASLASVGGYSRASFASHFKQYFGQAPLEYLSHLRLTQAKKQLMSGDTVLKVALDVGYGSDVTFAKAYKRYFGHGPGASRP